MPISLAAAKALVRRTNEWRLAHKEPATATVEALRKCFFCGQSTDQFEFVLEAFRTPKVTVQYCLLPPQEKS